MFSSFFNVIVLIFINYYSSSNCQQLECGIESPLVGFSFGGKRSQSYESPWKIALFRNDGKSEFSYNCGGVLINNDTVVTGEI